MTTTRRLAAILAADVVGYSRLMGADEVGTLEALKAHRREVVDPAITANHGRIVKTTGDGMLVEFASAVDAVTCAVSVQEQMAQRATNGTEPLIQFRIGINIGDIISEGDDIFGDGVNVAARVENECEPGGVYLSGSAHEQVTGKTKFTFEDLGERTLKNIARPVRLYAVRGNKKPIAASSPEGPLVLPDKPSIAVLPFANMSGDPEQEYFADGMVEEIITALSRFRWVFVIARTSTFSYKGRAIDVKQVGRELGVRYVLEGSVRKSGDRVRITGQLIDAANGAHLWADNFEGSLKNIFDLQDQVASGVVGALDPKLLEAEVARVKRKPVANLDAYDCFLRASDHIYRWTKDDNEKALQLLYRAIELDPDYAQAYAFATHIYISRGPAGVTIEERREAERLAREAARLGKDDAFSLCWAGMCLAMMAGKLEEGAALIDRAIVSNPNLARSWNLSGWVRLALDQPEIAIEHLARAMRLSPLDLAFHAMQTGTAFAHLRAGRYGDALVWAEKAMRSQPNSADAAQALAMAKAAAGDLEAARNAMERVLQLDPGRRISSAVARPLSPERRAWITDLLRKAGMPE